MRPDKKVCLYCGKEIDGKKLYCDDAHRMAFKRQSEQEPEQKDNPNTNKVEQILPEQAETEQPEQSLRDSLTKTDKTFYDRAMKDFREPYYHFGEIPVTKKVCDRGDCKQTFKTTLRLLRYCSYDHYTRTISGR